MGGKTSLRAQAGTILALLAILAGAGQAQNRDALQKLGAYLNGIGYAQLERRAQTVAAIDTREQADRRKAEVRQKILNLIGGLSEARGPVPVKQFGAVPGDGFRIEKIAYQSLPGFHVTADVFVPSGPGPFPAIVVTPGHGPNGKLGEYNWGANFARAGILALVIDTFGQGERMQHYDPELAASKVEPSGEHEHASLSTLLIGDHVSRYFINDGMRGVDYLIQRGDVDGKHIGAYGCSGGGTVTAYLAALDPRISVAAPACYITSFKELLPTRGPQEAEQTIPGFLAEGLDFADWVELASPRPYAIISTAEDMFPYAGARQTYEEARRIYGLDGAEDKLQWITGPGGHCNLGPISNQILAFLVRHLKNDSTPPNFGQFRAQNPDDLLVTPTGQVSTSMGGATVESVNRKQAQGRIVTDRPITAGAGLAALQARIRATAGIIALPGAAPPVTPAGTEQLDGYRLDNITIESEPGIELGALVAIPDRLGPKPVVVMVDGLPKERVASGADFIRLAKAGHVVVALQPRGTPADAQGGQSSMLALGPYMGVTLRAIVVGKTLVGMRVDDVIRVINWLTSRADVDRSSITLYGRGAHGMVALHAAALDSRITRVVVESTLVSYRMALDATLHRNLSEITVPGVLKHYDVSDLVQAISPRELVIVNPVGAVGQPVRDDIVRQQLAAVLDSGGKHIRLLRRGFRDPLPID